MSRAAHELRVLDGLHAGARAALDGDAAPLRLAIGSALDNDIVLCDPGIAPRHAWLQWDAAAARWHLLPQAAPGGTDAQAQPPGPGHGLGEAVALGPVHVTVAAANDPFDPAAAAVSIVATPLVDEPPPGVDAEALPPPAPPARRSLARRAVLLLLLALPLLLLAAVLPWWLRDGAPPQPAQRVPPAVAAPAAAPVPQALHEVLRSQGLDGALQVHSIGGRSVVSGLVADAATLETLAAALTRLSPRPGLRVSTVAEVRAALRETGFVPPPGLQLAVDRQGALRLGGTLGSEAAAVDVQQRLRALLPAGVVVASDIEPPVRLAERFVAEARAQGFAIDGGFDGRRLVATIDLPEAERSRWERWLVDAHRRLLGGLGLALALRAAPPPPRSDTRLPFRVASVVGGASPYLLLADGKQLVPGARAGDVTLVQIDDDALVLQRAGQTFKVPR